MLLAQDFESLSNHFFTFKLIHITILLMSQITYSATHEEKRSFQKSYERATLWILIKQQVGIIIAKKSFLSYKMVCGVFECRRSQDFGV